MCFHPSNAYLHFPLPLLLLRLLLLLHLRFFLLILSPLIFLYRRYSGPPSIFSILVHNTSEMF